MIEDEIEELKDEVEELTDKNSKVIEMHREMLGRIEHLASVVTVLKKLKSSLCGSGSGNESGNNDSKGPKDQ